MNSKRYGAIDGLRTIACVGIVLMHVAANNSYSISGFIYESVIPSFTNFVFLFMIVSAFGMCCGYYEKIIDNKISFNTFYGKRFKKILPFFGLLVLLDVIMSPSAGALYEAFADLSLLFGFLPNAGNISVIGVGWFIGLIFVFYIIFPFFCVLIQNKRRAWMAFAVSLIYNFICTVYFDVGRNNNHWIGLGAATVSAILYYPLEGNTIGCLLVSVCWLSYTIICSGGGYCTKKLHIGKQNYKLYKRYQHGDISFPYGYFSCSRKAGIKSNYRKWLDAIHYYRFDSVFGSCSFFSGNAEGDWFSREEIR